MSDPDFESFFRARLKTKEYKAQGYAKLLSESLSAFYGDNFSEIINLPNNILAVSYISALQKLNSPILPHTVFRIGTDEDDAKNAAYAGATYLRSLLLAGKAEEALSHVPNEIIPLWKEAFARGLAPVSYEKFSPIFLSFLRMQTQKECSSADGGGGILPLLQKTAREATTLDDLISRASTKKYTCAHLRRALLFAYFGVTPALLKQKPLYTQVLAMDERGRAILAHIRKTSRISLLTKPADLHKLSESAREQAVLSYRADSVYALALPTPQRSDIFLSTAPCRK
jgi:predicted nucleotidyltransferase